ncbi:hypothetical protein FH609_012675 [Streptomyces sp. 3MP-14]|uniref:L,D-transpeptidase n=1 Tax=Streptomyces mimosae TaxID=2586635 RepID=A0A5N6AEZ8_9ACTN|nr:MULTISPECIES: hypothetical protein [Streptomyces]KAB8167231.1 hypothetical protein FH607_010125 [Streptomyces mimosae]KAB8177172.1 hypothetical protein FH609_012675 [Streptomyces sp. 3MP-14]
MARHSSGSGSGVFVAALTTLALAVVGFFAYQASAADNWPPPPSRATPTPEESEGANGDGDGGAEGEAAEQPAVPAESGEGRRVVYALEQRRVWLVDVEADGGETLLSTYEVFPSALSPEPGTYAVSSRSERGTGSDGVPMEHAVVFHVAPDGTVFGFSAALDGSTPNPGATQGTGGIRQSREDGAAMWDFARDGVLVVVVP